MKTHPMIKCLFLLAALYDGLLGLAFLLLPSKVFAWIDLAPPNHLGYVQFPAALLVVFAILYAAVAFQPVKNRNLIPYGILLKVSYCSVVLYHWLTSALPSVWKAFFVADLVFLVLFLWAWKAIGDRKA
jgi:hypothetical protein